MSAPEHATPQSDEIPAEWLAEFEAAARRPLRTRFRYAFIHTYKPALDDEPFAGLAGLWAALRPSKRR